MLKSTKFFQIGAAVLKLLLSVVALLSLSGYASAQAPPDAGFIVNSAIRKLDECELLKKSFSYTKKHVVDELDNNTRSKKHYEKVFNGTFKLGTVSETLAPGENKGYSPAPTMLGLKEILASGRYNYLLEGMTILDEKVVYAIRFEPRHPSKQPKEEGDSRQKITNRILNNLTGTLYIDRENFLICRAEAHLNSPPITIYIAKLYQFDVTIEQREFEGLPVVKRVIAIYRYDKFLFWFQTFNKETLTFESYTAIK